MTRLYAYCPFSVGARPIRPERKTRRSRPCSPSPGPTISVSPGLAGSTRAKSHCSRVCYSMCGSHVKEKTNAKRVRVWFSALQIRQPGKDGNPRRDQQYRRSPLGQLPCTPRRAPPDVRQGRPGQEHDDDSVLFHSSSTPPTPPPSEQRAHNTHLTRPYRLVRPARNGFLDVDCSPNSPKPHRPPRSC